MLWKFLSDERAATAIEYGVIGMLIGIAVVIAAGSVGPVLEEMWTGTATKMQEAGAAR